MVPKRDQYKTSKGVSKIDAGQLLVMTINYEEHF